MSALARDAAARPDLRTALRRPGDALPRASIGTVPILWNNVDLADLRHGTDASTILDEIARTGFEGTQLGHVDVVPEDGYRPDRCAREGVAWSPQRCAKVRPVDREGAHRCCSSATPASHRARCSGW